MKNAILGLGLAVMAVITALILFTVYGQNTRQNELDEALSTAVEQSLENLKIDKHYTIEDKDELIADLNQNLILSLESDSEVVVKVLAVDMERGLIDVEVTETFKQPNKTTGRAVCRKTIVVDEFQELPPTYNFVTFYTRDKDGNFTEYSKISVATGSDVFCPMSPPKLKGYVFKGWSLEGPPEGGGEYNPTIDYEYDSDNKNYTLVSSVTGTEGEGTKMIVTSEMNFYAVFELDTNAVTETTGE